VNTKTTAKHVATKQNILAAATVPKQSLHWRLTAFQFQLRLHYGRKWSLVLASHQTLPNFAPTHLYTWFMGRDHNSYIMRFLLVIFATVILQSFLTAVIQEYYVDDSVT